MILGQIKKGTRMKRTSPVQKLVCLFTVDEDPTDPVTTKVGRYVMLSVRYDGMPDESPSINVAVYNDDTLWEIHDGEEGKG